MNGPTGFVCGSCLSSYWYLALMDLHLRGQEQQRLPWGYRVEPAPRAPPAQERPTNRRTGHMAKDKEIQSVIVTLRGLPGSPLVIHAFSEKAKAEIRAKQQKKVKRAKEERKPEDEFLAARYVDGKGRECAPVTALKKAIITAASAFDGLTKVALRQAIFVAPTVDRASQFVPIEIPSANGKGSPAVAVMREDPVTIGMGTRALTYRPEYAEWQLRITIDYNPRLVSEDQLRGLVEQAGWGVGICEGRPEKTSALGWGRFEIQTWERAA